MATQNYRLDALERKAVRDFLQTNSCFRRSAAMVDDIIKLAVASASRTCATTRMRPSAGRSARSDRATPALEQRLVSLFLE